MKAVENYARRVSSAVPEKFLLPAVLAGLFLVVFGAKLLLIARYGNPTPYWDQWDAEAGLLYKPYLEGTLNWDALLRSHNEHRIFFTRVLGLILLESAGEWDPMLQMVVNAILHSAFLALLVWFLAPLLKSRQTLALSAVTALVFAIPLGWENSLAGFQSQFYFLLIFSSVALYLFVDAKPFGARWWLALALCICAYFSLASGSLAILAAIALWIIQIIVGTRPRDARTIVAIAVLALAAALMLAFTVTVKGHYPLKAHSAGQYLQALWGVVMVPLPHIGAVLHLPLLWFAAVTLRDAKNATRTQWLLLALAGWLALQMGSIAYGRAVGTLASRYSDIFLILLPLDFAALLWLCDRHDTASPVIRRRLPAVWATVLLIGLAIYVPQRTSKDVNAKAATMLLQQANASAYLSTGDANALVGKPIPYPSADRLARYLSDRTIRSVLPSEIRPSDVDIGAVHSQLLLGGWLAAITLAVKRCLLWSGPLLMVLGAALLLAAFFRRDAAPAE